VADPGVVQLDLPGALEVPAAVHHRIDAYPDRVEAGPSWVAQPRALEVEDRADVRVVQADLAVGGEPAGAVQVGGHLEVIGVQGVPARVAQGRALEREAADVRAAQRQRPVVHGPAEVHDAAHRDAVAGDGVPVRMTEPRAVKEHPAVEGAADQPQIPLDPEPSGIQGAAGGDAARR